MDTNLLTAPDFWSDPTAVVFQTSGSSGIPKQVAFSKEALLISAAAVNRHLGVTVDSCWGLALPPEHVGGFGVAARAYEAACRFERFPLRWQPAEFQRWLSRHAVTHTSLVPAQVYDLVIAGLTAPAPLAVVVVGGGELDFSTGRAARGLGWPVLASYGMTEAASQIATQGLELLETPYSPAPIPLLPIWEVELTGDGLIAIAGPALFSGYVSEGDFLPRETKWYITSDRALVVDRTITPLGRADSLVKILGELVDPLAIEQELLEGSNGFLGRGAFAIIAVPHERAGQALVPVFETGAALEALLSALEIYQVHAPGFRRLLPPLVVGEFPRSPLGKLRRNALVEMYLKLQGS